MSKDNLDLSKIMQHSESDLHKLKSLKLSPDMLSSMVKPPNMDYPTPPAYEDTFLRQQADDIKAPLERQLNAVENIAESAKTQAVSSKDLAKSAQTQANLAQRKADKADIKGTISVIAALSALAVSIMTNHVVILEFIQKLMSKIPQP